ncbi:uncharacterized protein LOC112006058 [Quercus suber]|uniref:uncharacterized protein LOC112006058 n=1 Tax=Quercus suber TaxID=58331 RepID=UPI000CE1F5BE|nr:uncharacterized protein LOC112006058 [Quercus suber]
MDELINRLPPEELDHFLVHAWIIWHQRNVMIQGKQLQAPRVLNKRAQDFTEEFRRSNTQLSIPSTTSNPMSWRPPPFSWFKLNFDTSIFKELGATGVRAIIRNDRGEVMASLSAKGPPVTCNDEVEILACHRTMEFAVECGFTELVIEGNNQSIMTALRLRKGLSSRWGHILQDVVCMLNGLRWSQVQYVIRSANTVAHALARYAKDVLMRFFGLKIPLPQLWRRCILTLLPFNEF